MSKAREDGVRNPLLGCLLTRTNPYNINEMARLATLDAESTAVRPWDAAKFKKELSKPGTTCLAIEHDGVYLGAAIVQTGHIKASLIELIVHTRHRRRGIGTYLLKSLDQRFLTESRRFLEIAVPELNIPMQMFLKSNNIKATDVIRGPEMDHYLFRAELGYSESVR